MSTSLTREESEIEQNPPLGQLLLSAQQWTFQSLLHLMAARGHVGLTAAHMMFLANLDCGVTHASLVARRMGVSRQAVYRTTRELQALRVLSLENDPERGNQKIIRMTPHGQKVITHARACLNEVEATLRERIGSREFERLVSILQREWGAVLGRDELTR